MGGYLFPRAERCSACSATQCTTAEIGRLSVCSYGFGYTRVSADVTLVGLILRSFSPTPDAYRKVLRKSEPHHRLSAEQVGLIAEAIRSWLADEAEAFAQVKRDQMAEIRAGVGLGDIADELGEQIRLSFGQVHDYRAFAAQIKQNVIRQLERRSPGLPLDDQLAAADHELAAIYWASELMITKLEAVYFLQDREALGQLGSYGRTKFHSLFLKYLRIYQYAFDEKGVKIAVDGTSHSHLQCNVTAAGLIPQALIDNALKYAPSGSTVRFHFEDDDESELTLEVSSYGPTIDSDEEGRIFEPFYRGRHAQDAEGAGVGLALVGLASEELGARVSVEQDVKDRIGDLRLTTFTVAFDLLTE